MRGFGRFPQQLIDRSGCLFVLEKPNEHLRQQIQCIPEMLAVVEDSVSMITAHLLSVRRHVRVEDATG